MDAVKILNQQMIAQSMGKGTSGWIAALIQEAPTTFPLSPRPTETPIIITANASAQLASLRITTSPRTKEIIINDKFAGLHLTKIIPTSNGTISISFKMLLRNQLLKTPTMSGQRLTYAPTAHPTTPMCNTNQHTYAQVRVSTVPFAPHANRPSVCENRHKHICVSHFVLPLRPYISSLP